mmetsp:Transcript_32013/g.69066  ORF Transcript_32013/g.69066 Transcript_32013/m.69066 type:complete len:342 (+) Transcript_32013:814-1839(+)
MFVRIPGKAHQLGQRLRIPRMPQEVVSAEGGPFLLVLQVRQGILTHRPGFGIVVGGVHVQVQQVLSRVFSYSEVPGGGAELIILRRHRRGGLVKVLELLAQVLIVRSLAVAVGVRVGVRVARVRIARVCVILLSFSLPPKLSSALLAFLLQQPFLCLQTLLQFGSFLHLCGLHSATLRLHPLPVLDDLLVIIGLKTVPTIPFAVVVQIQLHDVLVWHEILTILLGRDGSRALHTVLLGVSGGTAIFTGTLDELGLHITLGTSNVPVPGAHRLGIPGLVMLQGRLVLVQIPRRLCDELWVVRVDHLPCELICLRCGRARSSRLLQGLLLLGIFTGGEAIRHC